MGFTEFRGLWEGLVGFILVRNSLELRIRKLAGISQQSTPFRTPLKGTPKKGTPNFWKPPKSRGHFFDLKMCLFQIAFCLGFRVEG